MNDSTFYTLVVQSVARCEDKLNRLLDRKTSAEKDKTYLRNVLRRLREDNAKQKMYIRQLESELRMRGLE